MQELVGKLIYQIWVNDVQNVLIFKTRAGLFIYRAEGDCCSETWFADIEGVAFLLMGTVIRVEEIPEHSCEDNRSRQEEDLIYGYAIRTNQGDASIIFRNSSNGYYDGWCKYAGHLLDFDIEDVQLRGPLTRITKDWSA